MGGLKYNFPKERTSDSYVLRLIAVLPEARLIRGTVKVRRHETMKAAAVSGCQGTPWSEELDGKELHRALGGESDVEPTGSASSCTSLIRSQPTFQHLQVWYYAGFKEVVF